MNLSCHAIKILKQAEKKHRISNEDPVVIATANEFHGWDELIHLESLELLSHEDKLDDEIKCYLRTYYLTPKGRGAIREHRLSTIDKWITRGIAIAALIISIIALLC